MENEAFGSYEWMFRGNQMFYWRDVTAFRLMLFVQLFYAPQVLQRTSRQPQVAARFLSLHDNPQMKTRKVRNRLRCLTTYSRIIF